MIKLSYEEFNSLNEFTSVGTLKFQLGGVYFDVQDDGSLDIVACDGRRMIVVNKECDDEEFKKMIDKKILGCKRKCKKGEVVYISYNGSEIRYHFISEKTKKSEWIIPEVIEGKFPNYKLYLKDEQSEPEYTIALNNSIISDYFPYSVYKFYGGSQIMCKPYNDDVSDEYKHIKIVYMPMKFRDDEDRKCQFRNGITEDDVEDDKGDENKDSIPFLKTVIESQNKRVEELKKKIEEFKSRVEALESQVIDEKFDDKEMKNYDEEIEEENESAVEELKKVANKSKDPFDVDFDL